MTEITQSLITQLADNLFASKALETATAKYDTGRDVVIGVPLTARPFLLAAAFVRRPRPILVVVSGEEAAGMITRELAAWLGNELILQLPTRTDYPWRDQPRQSLHVQQVGQRARAIEALATGQPRIVVASARALLRCVPPPPNPAPASVAPLADAPASEPSAAAPAAAPASAETAPHRTPSTYTSTLSSGSVFAPLRLTAGEDIPDGIGYDRLSAQLVARGYERLDRLDHAEQPGSFSLHGDTLDIYPAGYSYPVRVELFGDTVEIVRRLVPATGQSIGSLARADIYPAREIELSQQTVQRAVREISLRTGAGAAKLPAYVSQHVDFIKQGIFFNDIERYLPFLYPQTVTPISYLSPDTMVVLIEPRSLYDDSMRYYEDLLASAQMANTTPDGLFVAPADMDFGPRQRLTLLSLISGGASLDARLEVKHADGSTDERLVGSARSLLAANFLTVLAIAERRAREAAELALSDAHIPFRRFDAWSLAGDAQAEDQPPGADAQPAAAQQPLGAQAEGQLPGADAQLRNSVVNIADTDLATSLVLPAAKLALLALGDSSRSQAAARKGRSRRAVDPTSLTFPFKPGDYVVHATHGIALFKAIVRQEVVGVERDYLHLEYAHGDKLFTPVEHIDKITRYVGPESSAPRLTRLNTSDWSRATGKARKAARELAFDLVDLYARRSAAQGFAYSADNDQQYLMELAFPYQETPDQLAAIADVKADMESARPMDRLICGDVGFGKTEVALRAAFKAVQSGKQVMLLCPTTILAQQHFVTFSDRFDPFAVRVEVLSRFRSAGQQKRILEGFTHGAVDVLVGTHRLLSADVNPKELGLIIIDEEQRFGVQHKEQLKNLREQVDVLTLSATPIPRTMQMAISGVRDMSLIDTPPASRTPIRVHVGEWDEDVVSAAIRREMERGGQVYYVSNRVKSIDDAVARVQLTAPEARICIAHGKMTATQLERVMEGFAANQFDVLVATTIIESGLDNPHTNTLIIEDSQRLGLAQLYQLKGRVGRSHAQAYAFFLFPSENTLTPEAIERLTAIDEFQELGSGLKIAMRDLEIRGAGSLLGAEQHGMLSAVGFDLFASMLQEAVLAARSGNADGEVAYPELRIDLPVPFFLPEEFVAAADERVLFYRRLAAADDAEAVERIEKQLIGSYGALPAPAQNLVNRSLAKALAGALGITSISLQRNKLVLEPVDLSSEQAAGLKAGGGLYMVKSKRLSYPLQDGVGMLDALINLLIHLAN